MTINKSMILGISLILSVVLFQNCTPCCAPSDVNSKEYTSAYVCAKHCEGSGSDVSCKCPKCGADQVDAKSLGYTCPMHKEMTGKKGQKCGKCKKDLEEKSSS